MKTFVAMMCLLLSVLAARAQSGNELHQQFLTNSKALVFGYIKWVLDKADVDTEVLFHFYFDTYDEPKTIERIERDNQAIIRTFFLVNGYCVPEEATVEQKADVFCKYLLNNPDQRTKNAAELLGSALRRAWPCK